MAAAEKLRAADVMIQKRRWESALPLLQDIIEAPPEGLVEINGRYVAPARRATARIASLPAEARRIYRLLYEPEAERLYRRAIEGPALSRAALLEKTHSRYLNTNHGLRAASAHASLLMDGGEFAAALRLLRETDAAHPAPPLSQTILAKKLLCLVRLGRTEQVERLVRETSAGGMDTVLPGGRATSLREFVRLAREERPPLKERRVAGEPPPNRGWSTTRLATRPGGTKPPLCRRCAAPIITENGIFARFGGDVVALRSPLLERRWTAWAPDAWRGLLPRPTVGLFDTSWPDFLPIDSPSIWRDCVNQGMNTLSADGRSVYAVQIDYGKLRCYSAADGRLSWCLGGQNGVTLKRHWFLSAPTAQRGRAYVAAIFQGRLYALCLDARTGQPLWRTELGALHSRQEVTRYLMELYLADAAPPALAEGVAVFPTGEGAICGLDARDGTALWATPYRRSGREMHRLGEVLSVPSGTWRVRTPATLEGVCVATPLDSRCAVALSLATGELLWQREFEAAEALLGAGDQGNVYIQHRGLSCIHARTGRSVWEEPDVPYTGAGACEHGMIYVPQTGGVQTYRAEDGGKGYYIPWPAEQPPCSDVAATDDLLIALGGGSLSAWGRTSPDRLAAPPQGADAQDPAHVARARLKAALKTPGAAGIAGTYLDIVETVGQARIRGPWTSRTFWPDLAAALREACAEDARTDAACRRQFTELIERAAQEQDVEKLLQVARWSPFPELMRDALAALVPAAAGRERKPLASRVKAELAVLDAGPTEERGLEAPPSSSVVWERAGYPVPESGPPAGARDTVLVLGEEALRSLRAEDGEQLWQTDLWPAQQAHPRRRQYWGAGHPRCYRQDGRALVALPAQLLNVDLSSGKKLWAKALHLPQALDETRCAVPRRELMLQTVCGRPTPSENAVVRLPLDDVLCGPVSLCRIAAGVGAFVIDPLSGEALFTQRRSKEEPIVGVQAAPVGERICLLLPGARRLLVVDARDGYLAAVWQFPETTHLDCLLAGPDQRLYVGAWGALYRFDISTLTLERRWQFPMRFDRLLFADRRMLALSTADGDALAVSTESGRPIFQLQARQNARTVWAAHRDGQLYLLDVTGYKRTLSYGGEPYWQASGCVMRAVGARAGEPRWEFRQEGKTQVIGPPVRCKDGWLLRWNDAGRVRLHGVDASTGRESFDVSLPAEGGPAPAPLLQRAGRVIVGVSGRSVALDVAQVMDGHEQE